MYDKEYLELKQLFLIGATVKDIHIDYEEVVIKFSNGYIIKITGQYDPDLYVEIEKE